MRRIKEWIKRNITPIEQGLVVLGIVAAVYSIHVSRTISLEAEEHQLLLTFFSNLSAPSLLSAADLKDKLRDYENARWDWMGHKREIELWRISCFSGNPCEHNAEAQLLCRHTNFTLRELQDDLEKKVPLEVERILSTQDDRSAERNLEALVIVGYYAQIFDSWNDAMSQIEKAVPEPKRSRISAMVNRIEGSTPRRRAGEL